MEEKKYLPIGSVVKTKKFSKKAMIVGYKIKTINEQTEIFDYVGCLYPEGLIDTSKYLAFNHSDIETVLDHGYQNEQYKQYIDILEKKSNNNQ